MRIVLEQEPFLDRSKPYNRQGHWPAQWIGHPQVLGNEFAIVAYRKSFTLDHPTNLRLHVSADQRYELFLDGERIGRGPERGDRTNWFFDTYDLDLSQGSHILVARTWWFMPHDPMPDAQICVRPAFLLAAEHEVEYLLNTGVASWECKKIEGYSPTKTDMDAWNKDCWNIGARIHIKGTDIPWGVEKGEGKNWEPVQVIAPAINASTANASPSIWLLRPALLPAMLEKPLQTGIVRHVQDLASEDSRFLPVCAKDHLLEESRVWNQLLKGEETCQIPARTIRKIIVDLEDYSCAYPEIVLSGGKDSRVQLSWTEALYEDPKTNTKGNRNEIEGKIFVGIEDTFETDGGRLRRYEPLWWQAGRYLQILISTQETPLIVESFQLRETHYPYQFESQFEASDPSLVNVIPLAKRVLEMCSHETYMDCPFYEQLMYIGDTRLQVLMTYILTHDDRLPRKAVLMFDQSRQNSGITYARYPSRTMQIIPPFSLWWIAMIHDYAVWRGDRAFIADRMPGVRAVLDAFRKWINDENLLEAPMGWNYMDWTSGWEDGVPPDGTHGISSIINFQMILVLRLAAELEDYLNEPELALRNRKLAERMSVAATQSFWVESRGLFTDDLSKQHFSEHAQCLALLGGCVQVDQRVKVTDGLLNAPDLARTTIYFTHYLFETYRILHRMDRFFERMGLWFDLTRLGLRTTTERPEPSRSDCHAWGAHPYYHYFASVLGIRPAQPGFAQVLIEPQLGPLKWAKGILPHPCGFIAVDFNQTDSGITGSIELPKGVDGVFIYNNQQTKLHPGKQTI